MSNVFSAIVRLSADAELRYIPSGAAVLSFNAASSTGFGDKQQTMWLRVTYWRNPEKLQPFLLKGGQIFVSGELSSREYEKDGQTKTSLELNANIIDLVGSKREHGQAQPAQQHNQQQKTAQAQQNPRDNFDDYDQEIQF